MTSLRSGRQQAEERENPAALWLIAGLLPLMLLGGWLSQFV